MSSILTINLHKLSKILKLALIIFIICGDFYCSFSEIHRSYAQTATENLKQTKGQTFAKQIDVFLNSCIKASKDEYVNIFGRYKEIIVRELSLERLYFVPYQEVENLLDQAVNESIDSLTLFTHPLLQNPKGLAIVFNEGLLQQINKNFNFHGLFNISIPSIDDDYAVKMIFFVIGQGKFIVGYDRNAKIKHPDYGFVTGKYDYRELFIMDAGKDSEGKSGLFNIKGLSKPNGKLQWMKGPLNVDIHSLRITSDPGGHSQILIEYDLFGINYKIIDPIPIEKLYHP